MTNSIYSRELRSQPVCIHVVTWVLSAQTLSLLYHNSNSRRLLQALLYSHYLEDLTECQKENGKA